MDQGHLWGEAAAMFGDKGQFNKEVKEVGQGYRERKMIVSKREEG